MFYNDVTFSDVSMFCFFRDAFPSVFLAVDLFFADEQMALPFFCLASTPPLPPPFPPPPPNSARFTPSPPEGSSPPKDVEAVAASAAEGPAADVDAVAVAATADKDVVAAAADVEAAGAGLTASPLVDKGTKVGFDAAGPSVPSAAVVSIADRIRCCCCCGCCCCCCCLWCLRSSGRDASTSSRLEDSEVSLWEQDEKGQGTERSSLVNSYQKRATTFVRSGEPWTILAL